MRIVASLHNEAEHIDRFLTTLEPFKTHVWLIDDASSDTTLLQLRRAGWNCIAGGVNRNKPGALKELLARLPAEIHTVVVLDPDVYWAAARGIGARRARGGRERPAKERRGGTHSARAGGPRRLALGVSGARVRALLWDRAQEPARPRLQFRRLRLSTLRARGRARPPQPLDLCRGLRELRAAPRGGRAHLLRRSPRVRDARQIELARSLLAARRLVVRLRQGLRRAPAACCSRSRGAALSARISTSAISASTASCFCP